MGFGFDFGGSKGSSKSSPWAVQTPFLTQGFEQAQSILQNQQNSPYANVMGQYGQMLAPSLGMAQNFNQQVLDGQQGQFSNPFASEQYGQIQQNYWNPAYQQAADSIRADTVEGLRRSDWGDAMGASMAGMGVGIDSDPYVKARLAQSEQASRGYQQALSGLHMGAMQQAQGTADQWAGANLQNQYAGFGNQAAAAGWMGEAGMQGINLQNQQYNQPWQDLQNYWNIVGSNSWGGKTKGKEMSAGFKYDK
jgi:hypothetical protein